MTAFCESEAMKCEESLWTLWLLWTLSELTTLWLFRLPRRSRTVWAAL